MHAHFVRFVTVSNRAAEAAVDPATTTWPQLHKLAADALDLDEASVKLVLAGTGAHLSRTPADEPIGDAASVCVFRPPHPAPTVISVIGVRNKIAQNTPRRPRTTARKIPPEQEDPSSTAAAVTPPSRLEFDKGDTDHQSGGGSGRVVASSPPPPPPPPSRVPVPPAEVLRGVIRDVEAAPNPHRRRRVITTNPVIDAMGANVRRFPSGESEAVLRELIERIYVVCPEFVEQVVKAHSRDFLDAINGVVGSITMPFATDAAAGVPGGAFVASLAEALSGVAGAARGGNDGGDDNDDDGAIEIRGDTVSANTLVDILSQAILAELANQTGIEIALGNPDDETGRDSDDDDDDDDDDERSSSAADPQPAAPTDDDEPRFVDLDQEVDDGGNEDDGGGGKKKKSKKKAGGKQPPHVARVAKAEKEVSRIRRELETAASLANASKHSAAAAQYHTAWCVLRRSCIALGRREPNEPTNGGEEDGGDERHTCVVRDIHGLQTKAVNGAIRSLSLSIRQRLASLLLHGAPPAAHEEESPNSPNSAFPRANGCPVNNNNGAKGFPTGFEFDDDDDGESAAPAPGFGFTEGQHTNAVLAALDDYILLESVASAAVITFVGADDASTKSRRSSLDTASALSTMLWLQDLRRYNDASFGLLEFARPSGSATRPMHGGMDAAPFGTTPPTPKLYLDAARAFLDRHNGNRRAAAALIEGEIATRSGPQPPTPTLSGGGGGASGPSPRRRQHQQQVASTEASVVDELGTFYDRDVAQLVRLSQAQNLCVVVYSSDVCFFGEGVAGTEMNPFLSLQEVYRARCMAKQNGTSVGFVVTPGGSICAELLSGVSYTVQRGLPRLVATTSDMACDDHLAELSRVLLKPLSRYLPPLATQTPSSAAAAVLSFVTLFSVDNMSLGHAAEVHQQQQSSASGGGSGSNATSPNKNNGSAAAGVHVSPEDAIIAPFGAMPLPQQQQQQQQQHGVVRVIDRYSVTVTSAVHSLLSSWSAAEAPSVRARIRGGPARGQRQRWLTAASARILNVRRQRERGAEEQTRWTVLADSSVPRDGSGISADLFLSTSAPSRDGSSSSSSAANDAFAVLHASAAVSSAVVSAWAPPPLHLGASQAAKSTSSGSPGAAAASGASSDDDDDDSHRAAGDLAHALRTDLHRHLVDQLCGASEEPLTVAAAFRAALLAVRAKYPEAGVSQWAPLVVLHSGRPLDGLRCHVRALGEEAADRTNAMRSRLTVRGPLSAAESRNVRYVQQHDIPGLLDTLCRELLATRPEGEAAVLDTLIATLSGIVPHHESPNDPAVDPSAAAAPPRRQDGM